jgi:hypothetical protein
MIPTKRFATAAAITAISIGSVVAPAMASTTHMSKSQCKSAAAAWVKKHPHATKQQKAAGTKTLKAHGCTIAV